MYQEHAAQIREHVDAGGFDAFRRVALFTLATIRVPLWAAAASTRAIIAGGPDSADAFKRVIWGSKPAGLEYLDGPDGWSVYNLASGCAATRDAAGVLENLTRVPGFGLAKAGFLAQMCYGLAGCLDTHNLRRFGLSPNLCALRGNLKPPTRARRIDAYLAAVDACGGTESLWDGWCIHLADRDPSRYAHAYDVSELHPAALGLLD